MNPGNSGGALIDMAGRLIGINSEIISSSGGSNGVGFAIPADLVAQFLAQAEAGADRFTRPWAGVTGQSVDTQIADSLGLDRPQGVLLSELHPESPFSKAGLKKGDVILAMAGAEVNSPQEVMFHLAVAGVGKTVAIRYMRGGVLTEARVSLTPAPDTPDRAALAVADGGLAGLAVANINPAVMSEMDLPLAVRGVVITGVEGPLTRSGMAVGDILLGINGEGVKQTADVARLSQSGGRRWLIDALRGGQRVRLSFRR